MIKIAICDDEPIFVSNNKTIVEQFIKRKKEIVTIDEYFNGEFYWQIYRKAHFRFDFTRY